MAALLGQPVHDISLGRLDSASKPPRSPFTSGLLHHNHPAGPHELLQGRQHASTLPAGRSGSLPADAPTSPRGGAAAMAALGDARAPAEAAWLHDEAEAAQQAQRDAQHGSGGLSALPFAVRNAPLLRVIPKYCERLRWLLPECCVRAQQPRVLLLRRLLQGAAPPHATAAPLRPADGVTQHSDGRTLLELEDLARAYRHPCIMDIKVTRGPAPVVRSPAWEVAGLRAHGWHLAWGVPCAVPPCCVLLPGCRRRGSRMPGTCRTALPAGWLPHMVPAGGCRLHPALQVRDCGLAGAMPMLGLRWLRQMAACLRGHRGTRALVVPLIPGLLPVQGEGRVHHTGRPGLQDLRHAGAPAARRGGGLHPGMHAGRCSPPPNRPTRLPAPPATCASPLPCCATLQVFRHGAGGYWRASKRWCKTLPVELVDKALMSFAHNGGQRAAGGRGVGTAARCGRACLHGPCTPPCFASCRPSGTRPARRPAPQSTACAPADVYGGGGGVIGQLEALERWFAVQRDFAFYSSSGALCCAVP